MFKTLATAVLLAAATSLYAQAPAATPAEPAQGKPRHHQRDCSKAKDPKACEEKREHFKAAHDKARQACESKQGDERRDCVRKEMCAQAKDPAQCEAKGKARAEKRKQHREATQQKKS